MSTVLMNVVLMNVNQFLEFIGLKSYNDPWYMLSPRMMHIKHHQRAKHTHHRSWKKTNPLQSLSTTSGWEMERDYSSSSTNL